MDNNTYFPPTLDDTGYQYTSNFTIRDHFAGLAMQALIFQISRRRIHNRNVLRLCRRYDEGES